MPTTIGSTQKVLGVETRSEVSLVEQLKEGLPVKVLDRFQAFADLSDAELDEIIPRRTRRHQRERGRLSSKQADKVMRATLIYAKAHRVFGDQERANEWMKSPHRVLEGKRPIELLDSSVGAALVEEALGRIEHGVYV